MSWREARVMLCDSPAHEGADDHFHEKGNGRFIYLSGLYGTGFSADVAVDERPKKLTGIPWLREAIKKVVVNQDGTVSIDLNTWNILCDFALKEPHRASDVPTWRNLHNWPNPYDPERYAMEYTVWMEGYDAALHKDIVHDMTVVGYEAGSFIRRCTCGNEWPCPSLQRGATA